MNKYLMILGLMGISIPLLVTSEGNSSIAVYISSISLLILSTLFNRATYSASLINTRTWLRIDFHSMLAKVWVLMLCLWVYGVFIGVLKQNNTSFIFMNFAGMVFYVGFAWFLLVKPRRDMIYKLLLIVGLFQLCRSFNQFDLNNILHTNYSEIMSVSDMRSDYDVGYLVIYVFGVVVLGFSSRNNKLNSGVVSALLVSLVILLYTFVALVTMSKGYILLSIILSIFITVHAHAIKMRGLFLLDVFTLILILLAFLLVHLSVGGDLLLSSFSLKEAGNSIRAEQSSALINEFTFWGAGLGATLTSGYTRDDLGYGFELVYLNIIHKFGIMSVFIFFTYFLTVVCAFKRVWETENSFFSLIPIVCLSFLVLSLGNPVLFSPLAVMLHSISLYLMIDKSSKEGKS